MQRSSSQKRSRIRFEGAGPGTQTADGSSVDLYRLLKPQGESEIIRSVLHSGASILELGSGVGRITHPLVQMGFDVVAVDNSAEMLAFVKGAEKVKADIETLDLGREFDAVLLMSHFINMPDASVRQALLATCRRHLAPEGIVIIQRHDPKWLDSVRVGFSSSMDGIDTFVDRVEREKSNVEITMRFRAKNGTWTHSFKAQRLDNHEIETCLRTAGLEIEQWLDDGRMWLSARASDAV